MLSLDLIAAVLVIGVVSCETLPFGDSFVITSGWSRFGVSPINRTSPQNLFPEVFMPNVTTWTVQEHLQTPSIPFALADQVPDWTMKGYEFSEFIPFLKGGCGRWTERNYACHEGLELSDYDSFFNSQIKWNAQACIQRMRNYIEGQCGRPNGVFVVGGCSCGFAADISVDSIQTSKGVMNSIMNEIGIIGSITNKKWQLVGPNKCDIQFFMFYDCSPNAGISTGRDTLDHLEQIGISTSIGSLSQRKLPIIDSM